MNIPRTATAEQQSILDCDDARISINALAGTGKTTTLIMYAEKNSHKRMLYLCYNKSIAETARKLFPQNVDVMTFHSLAYRSVGFQYKEKLSRNLSQNDVVNVLKLNKSARSGLLSQSLMSTLNNFCASDSTTIDKSHVDISMLNAANIFLGKDEAEQDEIVAKTVKLTQKLWHTITDLGNPHPINHDIYLKIFTLSQIQLNRYQTILIDEAQDLTSCFTKFIENQKAQLILVGDRHQSIYSWRGSVNYLDYTQQQVQQFHLTESFRFGPRIASYANVALSYLNARQDIKGSAQVNTKVALSLNNKILHDPTLAHGTRAIIARHNFSIYEKMIEFLRNKVQFYVEGGLDFKEIEEIRALYHFKIKGHTEHPVYQGYKSYQEIENRVNSEDGIDGEIVRRVMILSRWGDKTQYNFSLLDDYKKTAKDKKYMPSDIVLTTVHKSKGKEYDCVELIEDFKCHLERNNPENMALMYDETFKRSVPKKIFWQNQVKEAFVHLNSIQDPKWKEEMNIFYVALTRAKGMLLLSKNYYNTLTALDNIYQNGVNSENQKLCFDSTIYIDPSITTLMEKRKLEQMVVSQNKPKRVNKL